MYCKKDTEREILPQKNLEHSPVWPLDLYTWTANGQSIREHIKQFLEKNMGTGTSSKKTFNCDVLLSSRLKSDNCIKVMKFITQICMHQKK